MKIIAIIITVIGLLITSPTSVGINFAFYTAMQATKTGDAAGLGEFSYWIANAQVLGYANLFGVAVLFFGVVLMIITMFMGRKKQVAA